MDSSQELIDTVLTDHHQINSTKVSAAAYLKWRARLLREERRVMRRFWGLRDWEFTYVTDDSIVIAANTTDAELDALPAGTWASDGIDGGVWTLNDPKYPLVWKRPGEMENLQRTSSETGQPRYYTIKGNSTLSVFPPPSSATALVARYKTECPDPVDEQVDTSGNEDGLLRIPRSVRESVIYEGVVLREMKQKGDAASVAEQKEVVAGGVFDAVCTLREGKPWEQNMPRFPGGADVGPDDLLL